ncbi:MAG TPA: DNA mismatch repair protein, partial [Flavobacterium sp.]|nr:DNA mismatch repair protein [Flavobacterium sp.]
MEPYKSRSLTYSQELTKTKTQYNTISLLRLASILLFLLLGYYYLQESKMLLLGLSISFLIAFFLLMRWHSKLQFQIKMGEALRSINTNEREYLENNKLPFENGEEFIDFQHPYAYDLDVFGNHSLFQNMNRTATYIGKKTLAQQCVRLLPNEEIIRNQEAVKELADKLDWRQEFLALAKISQDTKSAYESLLKWSKSNSTPLSKGTVWISILSPVLFLGAAVAYWITSNVVYLNVLSFIFIFNLGFLGRFMKRIQLEIAHSSNIDTIISHYGLLLQKIEKEDFKAEKLIRLQKQLMYQNEKASVHLKQLASLFSSMDTIQNLITGVAFNGTFLFNLHIFKALIVWKNQHAAVLENWLVVMGEFEMLNSLANVSYNNPDFVFPELNTNYEISFSNLSHPLLSKKNRVGNDIDFQPQSFMILTGSNMSGKSTFLRSLGINMVLTGMGSVVCATQANVHPMPVLVSMRLADSLSDSESYFFAEIKRLKQIMDELDHQPAFVLLDEILRGTNSDDKRNGTIEVIKKVIAKKALGAIATHDIEVCLTTNDYPETLVNKCFEVEIINNDLHFDFVLRDGICKNKSATF